jgi:predicted amidohydrolase YtcJ
LIVLDQDPRDLKSDELMSVETRATMVGGQWVYDAR